MVLMPLGEAVARGSETKMRFAGAAKNICFHFFFDVLVAKHAVPLAVNLFRLVSNPVGWQIRNSDRLIIIQVQNFLDKHLSKRKLVKSRTQI